MYKMNFQIIEEYIIYWTTEDLINFLDTREDIDVQEENEMSYWINLYNSVEEELLLRRQGELPSVGIIEDLDNKKKEGLTNIEYKNCISFEKNTKKYELEKNLKYEKCCICLEEFKSQCRLHVTKCGHHFHPKCLRGLIQKKRMNNYKCPVCRTEIN